MEKNDIFCPIRIFRDCSHNFSKLSYGFFAMQNRRRISIFGCVLNTKVIERAFHNRKTGFIFNLVDERSLGTKVLRITEILNKKLVTEAEIWDRVSLEGRLM